MGNKDQAARLALAEAIENKVHDLDMSTLLKLAADLNVKVPPKLKNVRAAKRVAVRKQDAPENTILSGSGVGPVVSAKEGGRILDAISVDDEAADWADSELVGAGALVKRLDISRGTLDNWRKNRKIIAFRKGLRNYLYPVRQFTHLRPVEGLDKVAEHFSSPEEAWEWLVAFNRMTGSKPPIDALHEGKIDEVVDAANGALDFA